jgi:hypothetical protein
MFKQTSTLSLRAARAFHAGRPLESAAGSQFVAWVDNSFTNKTNRYFTPVNFYFVFTSGASCSYEIVCRRLVRGAKLGSEAWFPRACILLFDNMFRGHTTGTIWSYVLRLGFRASCFTCPLSVFLRTCSWPGRRFDPFIVAAHILIYINTILGLAIPLHMHVGLHHIVDDYVPQSARPLACYGDNGLCWMDLYSGLSMIRLHFSFFFFCYIWNCSSHFLPCIFCTSFTFLFHQFCQYSLLPLASLALGCSK